MKNKKIFVLYIALFVLMVIGVAYAFFSYISNGVNVNQLVTGNIYLNYGDNTEGINILNAIPETASEARSRVDNTTIFTVAGTNGSNNDIYYEIDLVNGEDLEDRVRLQADELRFDLYEVVNDVNVPLISNVSFDDFNNRKIWVDKVDKRGTSDTEYSKVYRLRMWISTDIIISDTDPNADYSVDGWSNVFGNVKIRVVGDFDERTLPYAIMKDDAKTDIASLVTADVTKVDFVTGDFIEDGYETATNKANLTKNDYSPKVYAYVDDDTLYIETDEDEIYLPVDASGMFNGLTSLTEIDLSNVNSSNTTNMSSMFNGCTNLTAIRKNDTQFDIQNVTNSANMFLGCTSLVGGNNTIYDASHIDASYAHVDTADDPGYFSKLVLY